MSYLDTACDLIRQSEGLRLNPYRCPAGYWTIGYGSRRMPDGSGVIKTSPAITRQQAETLLVKTVADLAAQVDKLVKPAITDNRKAALIDFAYNLGIGDLVHSTLLRLLNQGDFAMAADQFRLWVHAFDKETGKWEILPGLVTRRRLERNLFLQS